MVIEVGTFNINMGVEEFAQLDKAVADNYTSKQAGFISRTSGYISSENKWIFTVAWEDMASAQSSLAGFMDSDATKDFQSGIDFETMVNNVYDLANKTDK